MLPLVTLLGGAFAAPNLVVVSLDTTRADALSCYGKPPVPYYDAEPDEPRTPVLDAIAAGGVRMANFYAHAPSTLTSHASMFTGRDPHEHRVVRNGFPLPDDVPVLAERLAAVGYDTRAIIGAAALEEGMGLERGFHVYDDDSPMLRGLMYQAPANSVVDRTLATVDARDTEAPLFLFVHFFDAHAPYEPPIPFRRRFTDPTYRGLYKNPNQPLKPLLKAHRAGNAPTADLAAVNGRYIAELTWLDMQIGKLVRGLEERDILDDALLVVVGDHGEVLSDDARFAWTHGNDVSPAVLHVPLLLKAYGDDVPLATHRVVDDPTGMKQLAPTIETLLGLEPTLGTGFWDRVRPGPTRLGGTWPEHAQHTIFAEASRPRSLEAKTGWNNLPLMRAVFAGGWRMQSYPARGDAPVMDPGHPTPLLPVLTDLLSEWDAAAPAHRDAEMPEHTRRALEALGYLNDE